MGRLNWNNRQGPGDFDDTAPQIKSYGFDYARNVTGGDSWPLKFGPSTIAAAWRNKLVVVAEIPGFPYPVAVASARWCGQVLEVKTLEGYRIADRIWTRESAKGLTSSGLLIEDENER
jgi:hypothetical protein